MSLVLLGLSFSALVQPGVSAHNGERQCVVGHSRYIDCPWLVHIQIRHREPSVPSSV